VWENIVLPAPENGLVARRARGVAAGLDGAIAISEKARLGLSLAGVPDRAHRDHPDGVDVDHFSPASSPHEAMRISASLGSSRRRGSRTSSWRCVCCATAAWMRR